MPEISELVSSTEALESREIRVPKSNSVLIANAATRDEIVKVL